MFNPGGAAEKIAVAFITAAGGYYETPLIAIAPGWSRAVTIDPHASSFKCEATGWEFGAAVKGLDRVQTLILLVYNGDRDVTLLFSNIRTSAN